MGRFILARPTHTIRHGWNVFRKRKTMWQMVREALSGQYRVSLFTILVFVLTLAYVVFPYDLIPDHIPVLGWIDDGIVVYLFLMQLNKETERYIRYKAAERRRGD